MPLQDADTVILLWGNAEEVSMKKIMHVTQSYAGAKAIQSPCGTWIWEEKCFEQARLASCTPHGAPAPAAQVERLPNRAEEEYLWGACKGSGWRSSFAAVGLWRSHLPALLRGTHNDSHGSSQHSPLLFYAEAERYLCIRRSLFKTLCTDKLARPWKHNRDDATHWENVKWFYWNIQTPAKFWQETRLLSFSYEESYNILNTYWAES